MLAFLKMILAINSSKANGQNSPRIHKYSKCCDFISLLRKDVAPSVTDGVATNNPIALSLDSAFQFKVL